MALFIFWVGLIMSVIGIVAALFYLPGWLAFLLALGLALTIGILAADVRKAGQQQLQRFTHRPVRYWQGASDDV